MNCKEKGQRNTYHNCSSKIYPPVQSTCKDSRMKLVITSNKCFEKFYTKYKNMALIRIDASKSRSSTWLYNRKMMYLKKKRINPQKEYTWRISSLQKTQRVKKPKKLLDAIANYKESLDSPNHV